MAEEKKNKKVKKGEKETEISTPVEDGYVPRLLVKYRDEILPALAERFGYKNRFQVPKLRKLPFEFSNE